MTTKKIVTTNIITPKFEWGVIVAGAVMSLAVTFILLQFGSIIGLSADAPLRGIGDLASWGVIISGLWLLWTQLVASVTGGYIAGRLRTGNAALRPHDSEIRDGLAGALTWALATVVVVAAAALTGAFSTYVALESNTYIANPQLTNLEENTAIIFAFVAGATSLVSIVAAWWAAVTGGDHRDKGTDFSDKISFLK